MFPEFSLYVSYLSFTSMIEEVANRKLSIQLVEQRINLRYRSSWWRILRQWKISEII